MKYVFSVLVFALAMMMPAAAETIANVDVPISGSVTSCNGENVAVDGTAHLVLHVTQDNGGGFHGGLHINAEVAGTGDRTGAKYVGGVVLNANVNNLGKDSAQNLTVNLNVKLNGQGSIPNFKLKVLLHVTVNANGDLTAEVVNISGGC